MTYEREVQAVERAGGNKAQAARDLGIPVTTLKSRLERAGNDNFAVIRRSTLRRGDDDSVISYWETESLDQKKVEEAREAALEALAAKLPKAKPVRAPASSEADLCNLYTFTDYHLGMLAWNKEGGDDWDIEIGEQTLVNAFAAMIRQSPKADTAIINLQGDFLHFDGLEAVTPTNRHVLDADTRFSKLVAVAIRAIRRLVKMALERHQNVHLLVVEGNHDLASAVWLRHMFTALYDDEPRVEVNDSELPFYIVPWGETLLGFHHGHKMKNEALPLLFAAQFREAWGAAKRTFIHCGHRHHVDEKEYNGATVVQHPTLAARDAHAARGGWIAERAAMSITYHKQWGQVGRVCVSPEMVRA